MGPNGTLLARAFDTLTRDGADAAAHLLTENFIAHLPGVPEPLHGRDAWAVGVRQMLAAFPDLSITVEDAIEQGDQVALRVRFRGTHGGPFQGIGATHRPIEFTSVEIYRIEGDLIAEEWVAPDMITLMRQIS
ncbi:ester cyclase [Catenuloplanes atrovinosus]|uniref:Ester cyclase n=1 Tax=Catenuloplanes atrovinosus TaxID=137266 RepID=A0AAE4C9G8_9ACTN|nr:ester cyclase [Catenuloplanes atrovinosus]MDR7275802.1 putative ester cyclase [Catenuloplanes atrovinosus]